MTPSPCAAMCAVIAVEASDSRLRIEGPVMVRMREMTTKVRELGSCQVIGAREWRRGVRRLGGGFGA